jgi:hypothetical protein
VDGVGEHSERLCGCDLEVGQQRVVVVGESALEGGEEREPPERDRAERALAC